MGNILFCEKCERESESIINLSDNCVGRLTKGDKKKKCGKIPSKSSKLQDDEWMKKLKCLDDIHSHENGLTQQSVECLLCKVELQIDPPSSLKCPTKQLIICLKTQENCMIKCKEVMDEFIDCVDTFRINAMKARQEEMKKAAEAKEKAAAGK